MKNNVFFTKIPGKLAIAAIFVFGLLLVGCDNSSGDGPNNIPVKPAKDITVFIQQPSDWSGVYAYVWDDSGKEYNGSGSGNLLTNQNNGFYSFKAESAEYGYINVRFNNGSSKSALDILGVNTDTYFKSTGTFSGDSSKILLQESSTSNISAPVFKASQITDSTVTLTWDSVPGIDGYILYDEFIILDDDGVKIPGSEYWHFQKAFIPGETSIFDDNYGEYLNPECLYTWKLVAVKYKENANLSALGSIDPDDLCEVDYAPYYNVIYNFGKLDVKTKESSLAKPTGLRVVSTTDTSVELAWNAVPNADYYMVYWQDPDDLEWYYIEEAYDNSYLDNDEEFIEPGSSYKYYVVAHNKQTYSKDSNVITANTTSVRALISITNTKNISRAVTVTPSAPAYVTAGPNPSAANQINVSWAAVSGIKKYEVGLFISTASSSKPVSGSNKTISGTFYNSINYTYTSVPTSSGAYYVGVRTVDGSKYSSWKFSSGAVSAFPKISIQSATTKISGNYKTISIIMNASWKSGANYSYQVSVTDPQGYGGYTYTTTVYNTNTINIPNVPKGPKHTVTIKPYTGGVYGTSLIKSNL